MGAYDLKPIVTGEIDSAPPTAGDLPLANGVNRSSAHVDDPPVPQCRLNGGVRDSPCIHPLRCVNRQPDVRSCRRESWL